MRRLCFTVDLDRDVNDAVIGKAAAISMDRGQGTEPRFSSSEKGAGIIMDLMDDLGMRCTFFAEARTLRKTDVVPYHDHRPLRDLAHVPMTQHDLGACPGEVLVV